MPCVAIASAMTVRRVLPGQAEQQRNAIQQNPGGEGPEHKILGRGFQRTRLGSLQSGHDVEREGHQFGAEVDREEIGAGDHDHHAGQGQQDEAVVFADVESLRLEVGEG